MKFISAGHCTVAGPNQDPGAIGVNGRWEARETLKIRNRVIEIIKARGHKDVIQDLDGESLQQYLNRAKTGNGSTVCEFHFNAAGPQATGVETLVEVDADKMDIAMARELSAATSVILGIPMRGDRGVKTEADTRHKRLALMKEQGIIALVEVCFITNPNDMIKFDMHFETLCQAYATILIKYDALIQ
jgi:N-acetylmuramoyl-L-alanine amidase